MINIEETKNRFGYYPSTLTDMSSQEVVSNCDYCKEIYLTTPKRINIGYRIIKKDCCVKCKYKKREEVSLSEYGVKNSAQRTNIREKIKESSSERLKSEDFKNQAKKTNLEKYGNEVAMRNEVVKQKQKDCILQKYGVDNARKIPEISTKATAKMIETKIKNGSIKTYEGKTRPEWAKDVGFSRSHFGKLSDKYGIEEAMKMTPSSGTQIEQDFQNFLDSEDISYEKQFRLNIDKDSQTYYIADFKIDNILIECDGLYWHSDASKLDSKYHFNKQKEYAKQGYVGLFFREDELRDKFDIIKSILFNKLNRCSRIFARKCKLDIIDNKEADTFFINNHLMGKGSGATFVLKHDNQIIAALRLKRLKDHKYEISRFCCLKHYCVVGGFSRLLKFAIQNKRPSSITTFIDQRYGKGNYLKDLGFDYIHCYPSFRWTDGIDMFHRLKFPGNSGYDQGLLKIWDCGQSKWQLDCIK